jgi:hypothetical protein
MENLIGSLVLLFIAFLHLWAFWRVYKSPIGEDSVFVAGIWRGIVAGAVTNFFVSLLFGYLYGGYSGALIIYGLPFSIPIGISVTFVFLTLIKKLEIDSGFWLRATLGVIIGALFGIIIGAYFDSKNHQDAKSAIDAMFIYFSSIGLTSAIMAGEPQLND